MDAWDLGIASPTVKLEDHGLHGYPPAPIPPTVPAVASGLRSTEIPAAASGFYSTEARLLQLQPSRWRAPDTSGLYHVDSKPLLQITLQALQKGSNATQSESLLRDVSEYCTTENQYLLTNFIQVYAAIKTLPPAELRYHMRLQLEDLLRLNAGATGGMGAASRDGTASCAIPH